MLGTATGIKHDRAPLQTHIPAFSLSHALMMCQKDMSVNFETYLGPTLFLSLLLRSVYCACKE